MLTESLYLPGQTSVIITTISHLISFCLLFVSLMRSARDCLVLFSSLYKQPRDEVWRFPVAYFGL